MSMIEMQRSEMKKSDFTDKSLRLIQWLHGPIIKDMLLLPGAVSINVNRMDTRT